MGSASHLGYWADRKGKTPNRVPRGLFFGLVGLLAFTAGAILFGKTTGLGLVTQQQGAPVGIRDLMITRSSSDFVVVTDAATGQEIASYGPHAGGFVRGSLRAFERMRQVAKGDLSAKPVLAALADKLADTEWNKAAIQGAIKEVITTHGLKLPHC